jgi:two-component system, NarL family, sensor histidine kinase LiaS
VVRECVTNVHKHAKATQLSIRLDSNGKNLTIGIKDNGIGFDVNAIATGTSGLENMKFRARDAGMTLAISSRPSEGCVVQLVAAIMKET